MNVPEGEMPTEEATGYFNNIQSQKNDEITYTYYKTLEEAENEAGVSYNYKTEKLEYKRNSN